MTLRGLAFPPRIAKGLGVIAMIFSVITFLVAWGSSLPSSHTGRRD